MSNLDRCIYCKSKNIEKTTDIHFYCCSCGNLFSEPDSRVYNKILRKKALFETKEATVRDMMKNTITYVSKSGVIMPESLKIDISRSIGSGMSIDDIFSKLSAIEVLAEDIVKNSFNQK